MIESRKIGNDMNRDIENPDDNVNDDDWARAVNKKTFSDAIEWIAPGLRKIEKGGPGSGHHGHAGRPGKQGGSAPKDSSSRAGGSGDDSEEDVSRMYGALLSEGGFTYQPITNDSPKKGYALSIFPEYETVLNAMDISSTSIRSFMEKTMGVIQENPQAHLGGWFDRDAGKIYLDVSVIVNDADEARSLCRQYNQEGFYDLEKGETIIVKSEEERRKEEDKKTKRVRFEFGRNVTAEEVEAALKKLVEDSKKDDNK